MKISSGVTVDVFVSEAARHEAMEDDIRKGLSEPPRTIPPVWFYDEVGSLLFDEITRLPEYYLTRAEKSILEERSTEIIERSEADTLVEIGSGTSEKTRLLLDAMSASGSLRRIVLLDISEEILRQAAAELHSRYSVPVHAVVGDLRYDLDRLPVEGRRLWAFLGSTIGNFDPHERVDLLAHFSSAMAPGDALLLGTDLRKDPARLMAAYDDAAGVTARFNLNVLSVLNRELEADFDPSAFEHRAVWNPAGGWIEMRLRSRSEQKVHFANLDLTIAIGEGEELLTEISSKFDPRTFPGELSSAGLCPEDSYLDQAGDFLLTLARR
ncbi:MAG TPA: L-histidine N(alpha)-methyltransferase [Acidimicrobiales bacterium]|nr:L-histidine N(alpha)-methyltransferase [Acidimicrobiales bacterium]